MTWEIFRVVDIVTNYNIIYVLRKIRIILRAQHLYTISRFLRKKMHSYMKYIPTMILWRSSNFWQILYYVLLFYTHFFVLFQYLTYINILCIIIHFSIGGLFCLINYNFDRYKTVNFGMLLLCHYNIIVLLQQNK
jgi:hypothetical protein